MAKNGEFISGFQDNQIIDEKEMYGYRGSIAERFLFEIVKRKYLYMFYTVFTLFIIALAYQGQGYICIYLTLFLLLYLLSSSSAKVNKRVPARLPPAMRKYLKKWCLTSKSKSKHESNVNEQIGDFYVGNCVDTGLQIWKSASDFLTHTFILAGSGSGKTELIKSVYLCNMLAMSSGVFMMDFKGTVRLLGDFFNLALRFGRIDDFYVCNYNAAQKKGSPIRNSNTQNPFLSDTSYNSFAALDAFLDSAGSKSNDPFFKDNGLKILRTILPALHDLQSKNLMRITPKLIRKFVSLEEFVKLYHDPRVSDVVKEDQLIPAYKAMNLKYEGKVNEQTDENMRLYSNFINNFDPQLQFLTDEFPQIHEAPMSEFDPIDIVSNRRIAVSIIPTAAKSDGDVKNIAQSQVTLAKTTLGVGLGNNFHGSADRVMYTARTSADVPTVMIFDEFFVGLRASGIGTLFAQMRSTGTCGVAATQDIVAIEETNKLEAGQIGGSSANKFLMLMKESERSVSMIDPWIKKIKVPTKKITEQYQLNALTDRNAEIQEVPAFPVTRLFSEEYFPPGRFYFIGKKHQVYGQSFYYEPETFVANNYRPNVRMPCISVNEFEVDDLLTKLELTSIIHEHYKASEIELIDTVKKNPNIKNALISMKKRTISNFYKELLGHNAHEKAAKDESVHSASSDDKNTSPSFEEDDPSTGQLHTICSSGHAAIQEKFTVTTKTKDLKTPSGPTHAEQEEVKDNNKSESLVYETQSDNGKTPVTPTSLAADFDDIFDNDAGISVTENSSSISEQILHSKQEITSLDGDKNSDQASKGNDEKSVSVGFDHVQKFIATQKNTEILLNPSLRKVIADAQLSSEENGLKTGSLFSLDETDFDDDLLSMKDLDFIESKLNNN
jgi:hypothetical protein